MERSDSCGVPAISLVVTSPYGDYGGAVLVSAIKEAVQTLKDTGGWRSEGRPEEPCPKCKQEGGVTHTTIYGRTSGFCSVCSHHWEIE